MSSLRKLRDQLESELEAAQASLAFAEQIAAAERLARVGGCGFERALLAEGIDPLTADELVTGRMGRPSVARAARAVKRLQARLDGLAVYEARRNAAPRAEVA